MSRSTRQRKAVNYRKLLDDSDNSDDDFASEPPPKKPREGDSSVKSRGKATQKKSITVEEVLKKPARLSRDEKQFSRQLEQALTASKKDSVSNVSVSSEPVPSDADTPSSATCTAEKRKDGDFVPDESISSDESEGGSFSAVEEDDDSDFCASPQLKKSKKKSAKENTKPAPKRQQIKAKKPTAKSVLTDDKMSANSLPRKVARPTSVTVAPAKPIMQKATPSAVCVSKVTSIDSAKEVKSTLGSVKAGESTPGVLGVNKRMLNWTPPAKVGEGKTKTDPLSSKPTHVRSGSSGGGTPVIRVGLSRNARVRSLHTNIKT